MYLSRSLPLLGFQIPTKVSHLKNDIPMYVLQESFFLAMCTKYKDNFRLIILDWNTQKGSINTCLLDKL